MLGLSRLGDWKALIFSWQLQSEEEWLMVGCDRVSRAAAPKDPNPKTHLARLRATLDPKANLKGIKGSFQTVHGVVAHTYMVIPGTMLLFI